MHGVRVCVEVKSAGVLVSFRLSLFEQLKHHSVGAKFEKETEVKDIRNDMSRSLTTSIIGSGKKQCDQLEIVLIET